MSISFIKFTKHNNNTIVYREGPWVLDYIAKEIGYDGLMKVISRFYREYAGKYPLKYIDFINQLNESNAANGNKLNLLLSTQTLYL